MSDETTFDDAWDEIDEVPVGGGETEESEEPDPEVNDQSEQADEEHDDPKSDGVTDTQEGAGDDGGEHDDAGQPENKGASEPEPKDDESTWEQRYKSFEGRYKAEKKQFDKLSEEKRELEEELNRLRDQDKQNQTESDKANEDVFKSPMSEEFADEFPEVAEQINRMFEAQSRTINDLQSQLSNQVEQRLSPVEQEIEARQREVHFNQISKAHPDFESLVESGSIEEWINSVEQSNPLLADTYRAVYEGQTRIVNGKPVQYGTSTQVVNLIDGFKSHVKEQENRSKKQIVDKEAESATAVKSRPSGTITRSKPNKNDYDSAWDEFD